MQTVEPELEVEESAVACLPVEGDQHAQQTEVPHVQPELEAVAPAAGQAAHPNTTTSPTTETGNMDDKARKRIYSEIDRRGEKMTGALLGVYLATKGKHSKRQKLLEAYHKCGKDLKSALEVMMKEEVESVTAEEAENAKEFKTEKEMLTKWDATTVKSIIQEKLKDPSQWMWSPDAPDDTAARMYKVLWTKRERQLEGKYEKSKLSISGQVSPESGEHLSTMLAESILERPQDHAQETTPGRGRGRRGTGRRGRGDGAPKHMKKEKPVSVEEGALLIV